MGHNSSAFLLGIDIGTSSTKGCLYSTDGKLIASVTAPEYSVTYPQPGWAEEKPDDWLTASITCVQQILKKSAISPQDVAGVSISGLTPNCVPVDGEGTPIRPALLWIDRRSEAECAWLREHIGQEKCFQVSGNQIDSYFGGPKFLWYKHNEPDHFAKTKKILLGSSYVIYHLTNQIAVADHSIAGLCAPCYDFRKRNWSEEICGAMGIPIQLFPRIQASHEVIGDISQEAAEQTGLKAGTPVVAGGGDFACSTLGAGVIEEGTAAAMYGTAGNLLMPIDSPKFNRLLLNTGHVVRGKYLTLGSIFAGGILQWFRDTFVSQEFQQTNAKDANVFKILDEQASKIDPGSKGLILLPYFMGERTPIWDVHARGVYIGLTPYHTKAHLYRAVLEGIGYALNHIVENVKASGLSVREIIAINGGAKSRLWRQIISDILGIPQLYIPDSGGAPLGDAILAGLGVGEFKDASIVKDWLSPGERTNPSPESCEKYQKYYTIFKETYKNLKDLFPRLVEIGK